MQYLDNLFSPKQITNHEAILKQFTRNSEYQTAPSLVIIAFAAQHSDQTHIPIQTMLPSMSSFPKRIALVIEGARAAARIHVRLQYGDIQPALRQQDIQPYLLHTLSIDNLRQKSNWRCDWW